MDMRGGQDLRASLGGVPRGHSRLVFRHRNTVGKAKFCRCVGVLPGSSGDCNMIERGMIEVLNYWGEPDDDRDNHEFDGNTRHRR
ncbi:hypothetical protein MUK42_20606 [Musa troglodytarum]|uniref:Uncharacterized protein n=1 Tax=Musa troglodytarum TaxID=320322 RepID=A0A9E7FU17_9LILI|nr:hypothetical protein MUK42_20606 [Musa troglodytarum]